MNKSVNLPASKNKVQNCRINKGSQHTETLTFTGRGMKGRSAEIQYMHRRRNPKPVFLSKSVPQCACLKSLSYKFELFMD